MCRPASWGERTWLSVGPACHSSYDLFPNGRTPCLPSFRAGVQIPFFSYDWSWTNFFCSTGLVLDPMDLTCSEKWNKLMQDRAFVEEFELDLPNTPIKAHESPIVAFVWLNHLIQRWWQIWFLHISINFLFKLLNCHHVNHHGNAV